jgi:hypothetical protein
MQRLSQRRWEGELELESVKVFNTLNPPAAFCPTDPNILFNFIFPNTINLFYTLKANGTVTIFLHFNA